VPSVLIIENTLSFTVDGAVLPDARHGAGFEDLGGEVLGLVNRVVKLGFKQRTHT
jgi:hypothetical protein